MNKQFFCMLLCGVLALSTGAFVSCDDNHDDLKSRMTVIEGMIRDLKQQLENVPAGSTVTSAVKDANGVWTLTLSNGQVISITPSSGGGGSITVTETDTSIIITIDGKDYVFPKGSAAFSLVYAPEYVDGLVVIGDDGNATVQFLVKPALTNDQLGRAEFAIAAFQELKLRASDDVERFGVGQATLDGDFINVSLRALDADANVTYAVALQMTLDGSVSVSNFFNVTSPNDISQGEEIIENPDFVGAVTDFTMLEGGFSTATLPESAVDFLGTFNFKSLFNSLPAGNVTFKLGAAGRQNANVRDRISVFSSSLAADGTWTLTGRPGTNGDAPAGDANPSGILVNMLIDDVVVAKTYWKIIDPLADVDFVAGLRGITSQHMELPHEGGAEPWAPGAHMYDFNKEFTKGGQGGDNFGLKHGDAGRFLEAWSTFEVTAKDPGDILYNDGDKVVMGELGEKYAKFSRGLYWINVQTSVCSSQRNNLDEKDGSPAANNGEIISGYDGIPVAEMWDVFHVRILENGIFEFGADYTGQALRAGPGIRFEYAYGQKDVGTGGVVAYVFFNRRISPAGVVDPAPR